MFTDNLMLIWSWTWDTAWQNTLTTAFCLPIVYVLCWIFYKRPAVQNLLWLLLLVKLMTPQLPGLVWQVPDPFARPQVASVELLAPAEKAFIAEEKPSPPESAAVAQVLKPQPETIATQVSADAVAGFDLLNFAAMLLAFIWLSGVLWIVCLIIIFFCTIRGFVFILVIWRVCKTINFS